MARKKNPVPSYLSHSSGQARVRINGKDHYLGEYDSDESRKLYSQIIARIANGLPIAEVSKVRTSNAGISVAELVSQFVNDELKRFSESERHCQRAALRVLRQLFGFTSVTEFGPLKLRAVRESMVGGDPNQKDKDGKPKPRKPWLRGVVNRQVKRIQALFRWGVSWELVPESIAAALDTVRALTAAETTAGESKPRQSVPAANIAKVRAELKPLYQDVLDLLGLTGARPGELVSLRAVDIDQSAAVWKSELVKHKTAHKGKRRVLYFNKEAQAILLKQEQFTTAPEEQIFPCRRDNFGTAVNRACKRANVAPFVPHEVRHTAVTTLVDSVGLEATQQLAGHSTAAMTLHYSKMAEKQAIKAVKKLALPKTVAEKAPVKRTVRKKAK